VAQVVVENVYKSYSRSQGNHADTPSTQKIDGKSVKSKQVSVLRDINFTVADGEFLVLVGPSGCGKSTLLRLLAGLEELTGGNLKIGDRTINNLPPKARDIAMVFQNYALYPHLNIYDNIAFGLRRNSKTGGLGEGEKGQSLLDGVLSVATRHLPRSLRYLSAKEKSIRDRVRYVASLLQIEPLLSRLPKELSGGQKQRVALGRAIARNPQVFLMDEPLSNLDAKLRTQTRAQIVKLQRQLNTTTIYVTHDQTEAMTMGDRIAVMNNGQIQQIASPLEIYNHPANRFVAEFIGSPPMNFFLMDLDGKNKLVHRCFELNIPSKWHKTLQANVTKSLMLGIRPQHLSLVSVEYATYEAVYLGDLPKASGDNAGSNRYSTPSDLSPTQKRSSIQIEVDLVEALGNETYITAHLVAEDSATLTVSLPPEKPIAIGDILWLAIDLDKIHLFTVDDGRAIAL